MEKVEKYTDKYGHIQYFGGPYGLLHRLDGPAVILTSGYNEYWVNGTKYAETEYPEAVRCYLIAQLLGK
jgi:hypothetical protein